MKAVSLGIKRKKQLKIKTMTEEEVQIEATYLNDSRNWSDEDREVSWN